MKNLLIYLSVFIFLLSACVSSGEKRPKNTTQARVNNPAWGVTIDANYDKKLDGLVPGYKLITVALSNRGVDTLKLDPTRDVWMVEDAWGKKQKAIYALRIADPKTWGLLPQKVKDIIEYPAGVQVGFSQTFNLFFPEKIDLYNFRSIGYYSANLKKNFDALSSNSLERAVPASDQTQQESTEDILKLPKNSTKLKSAKQ